MKKLSMARRRVVVMASGLCSLAAISPLFEHLLAGSLHVPMARVVIPAVGLEVVAIAFVINALVRLKADEAAENGSGEV